MRNICSQSMIVRNWMACMSAFCALAAQHHAQVIGGMETNISDLQF